MESFLEPAVRILVGAAAALTAWQVMWKRGVRPFVSFCRKVSKGIDTVETLSAVAHQVAAEFRPNGGSSLRDQVTRIEAEIAHGRTRHHDILNQMTVTQARLEMHIDRDHGPKEAG